MLVAAFDLISFVGGDDESWARDLYRAASFVLIGAGAEAFDVHARTDHAEAGSRDPVALADGAQALVY